MLLPDPRLPSLREAWSPADMTRVLNEQALPALLPGERCDGVTIVSITYRPARMCMVMYAVRLSGSEGRVFVLATFGKPDNIERAYQQHYEGREEMPLRAALLRELGCLIELFPADYLLPALPGALDAEAAAADLSLPCLSAVEVMHYVPRRRCLLRYIGDGVELIGKLYAPGPGASRAWALLRDLDTAQRAGRRLTVAPVAFLERRDLVVMERSDGAPLHRLLAAAPDGQAGPAVAQAGATLAALHALDVDVAFERSIAQELAHTRGRSDRLRLVEPALAGEIDRVLDRVEPLLRAASAAPSCFVHGDYKLSQVLIDGDRAVALDFDRAARGDPALDVGNFLADLHRRALLAGRDGLRDLAGAFLEAYGARAEVVGLAERARLAQIVVLSRMAMSAFRHAPHQYAESPATSLSARLLREAQECLATL